MIERLKSRFSDIITEENQLRQYYKPVLPAAETKVIDRLDEHCQRFIERSPFAILSSINPNGHVDISPKGDKPGFIKVLDEKTILIPDRVGNNRLDTFSNILSNPTIGMFVLVPDRGETLRICGQAIIIRDKKIREEMAIGSQIPELVLAIHVDQVFFHCARCISKAGIWKVDKWPNVDDLINLGSILDDHKIIHLSNIKS